MTDSNSHKESFFNIRCDLLICLFLLLSVIVIYSQVRNYDFVSFDDKLYVTGNPYVKSGLTAESILWAFSFADKKGLYWQPLTWLSHILDCQFYGLNPGMHHSTSLILHIANSILLFLVFKRMTGELWKSACVAALFALHPINADSVAWVAERKNVLSTFFWILTMLAYVRYAEQPDIFRYLLVFSAFSLGLLAKPMLITLPFVLLLMDYWPLNRLNIEELSVRSSILWEKAPLFILSAASVWLSSSSLQHYENITSAQAVPMTLRIANALVSYVGYLWKMIWPRNLAIYYPYPESVPIWQSAGAFILLVCISLLTIRLLRRMPCLIMGWLWYLGTLVPVSGLIQTGLWPAMADRWAYIPLIGVFVMIAWGVPESLAFQNLHFKIRRYRNTGLAIISTATFSILMITTWSQVKYWRNSITIYEHTLDVTHDNYIIHYNMGNAWFARNKFDQAARHYSEALRIEPEYSKACNNLGLTLARKGNADEAVRHYFEALRITPEYSEPHNNLGNIFVSQGRLDRAIAHYTRALQLNPEFADARNNLGLVLVRIGKIEAAVACFQKALEIKSDYAAAHRNLGRALAIKEKLDRAVANMYEAMKISPEDPELQNKLENLYEKKKELDNVTDFYQKALSPQPGYTEDALKINNYAKVRAVRKEYNKILSLYEKTADLP